MFLFALHAMLCNVMAADVKKWTLPFNADFNSGGGLWSYFSNYGGYIVLLSTTFFQNKTED